MRPTRNLLRRLVTATRILIRDDRVPRPLKGLAAFAILPIPGPVDELALLLLALLLALFFRQPLREAWARAAPSGVEHARRVA